MKKPAHDYDSKMADDPMERAISLSHAIAAKEKESAALLVQLQQSLRIQAIWPKAFYNGPCKLSGRGKWADSQHKHHIRKPYRPGQGNTMWYIAWLVDGAGTTRYLTIDELKRLKPDVWIHPEFETPRNSEGTPAIVAKGQQPPLPIK
jgi:hypothetical protein